MKNIRDYGFIVEENTRHLLGTVYDILIEKGEKTFRRKKYDFECYWIGEVIGNNGSDWLALGKNKDYKTAVLSIPVFINLFSKTENVIGKKVLVKDKGESFPAFTTAFKALGFKNTYDNSPDDFSDEGVIFGTYKNGEELLFALRDKNGAEILISSKGIEFIEEKESNLNITDMEIYKERTIEINGKLRQVIISVVAVGQKLHAGYAITHIDDKFDEKIGKLVAKGRALNERTNLVDMELGKGMDKKFVLYSVADHIFKQLENGKIIIKGVK